MRAAIISDRQHRRATGETLDMARAAWRPPLAPEEAARVEADQIRGRGLLPIVSLTDHDEISGNLGLSAAGLLAETPVSLEWTVPFGATFFHIGVQMSAWIHAIELNGLRCRTENDAARQLAEEWRKPLISGGDRHGAEPNAAINLTGARTFAEFADEVRRDRHSEILLLPQYHEPLRPRWLTTVWDIVKPYPQAPQGRRHWGERFFYLCEDGAERSVAEVWRTPRPPLLTPVLEMLRFAESPRLRPALRLVLADQRS